MFTLRPATSADAPALTAIYAHYVTHTAVSFECQTPSVAEFIARMEQVRVHQLPYLVAEAEGQLLGYAYASPFSERPAYLPSVELTIYLAPSSKRQVNNDSLMQRRILLTFLNAPERNRITSRPDSAVSQQDFFNRLQGVATVTVCPCRTNAFASCAIISAADFVLGR